MGDDRKTRILIVDDEDDYRQTLMDRLIFEGFDVKEAINGADAVEAAREFKPDLVLLDIMMPLMNGYRCWSAFQKEEELKKIPILILTAKFKATDVFWGDQMSDMDYLNKSNNLNYILKRIRQKLDHWGDPPTATV